MSNDTAMLTDDAHPLSLTATTVLPMLAAGLFVWCSILGAEADPTALRWDALFLGCTLLLIATVARGVSGAAPEPGRAAGVLRGIVTVVGLVGLYDVLAMRASGDPAMWAAAAATAGALALRAHLGQLQAAGRASACMQP